MNESDFIKIERELNIILPEAYKKLLLNYPFLEEKYKFQQGSLISNVDVIIKINAEYRNNGFNKKEWKNNFFIFGTVADLVYFINLGNNDNAIYSISPENKYNPKYIKNHKTHDSFEQFVDFRKFMQSIVDNPGGIKK